MIGHGLLTWGRYSHATLLSAPTQLSLYISFMLFMKIMSLFIPPLCQCVVIFISILFIFTSPTWIYPPHYQPCPTWKRVMGWRRCALTYWLVRLCYRRHQHHPPPLDGSFFLSTHCKISWRWRRRSVRARSFCHWFDKCLGAPKKTPAKDNFFQQLDSLLFEWICVSS